MISFHDGGWVVVDAEGRFDTENLEEIRGLHWIIPDDPMRAVPLEIFMRDYCEPRLLPRLLNGEKFKQIRNLSDLNRVQPQVRIASIETQKDKPDLVAITVEVAKAKGERQRDKQGNLLETGVYDLRLFRNRQIVGQVPREADLQTGSATRLKTADAQELAAWRQSNQIRLDSTGKRSITFENIKLPRQAYIKQVEFSVYAFNEDRVKSQTDRGSFDIPADLAPRKGRAYGIGTLKQGLLTYALVKDGIEDGKADFRPADKQITISEWLEYGEGRVPKFLEEMGQKAKRADAPVELKDLVQKISSDVKTQRPSLFDFSRKRRDAFIVRQ